MEEEPDRNISPRAKRKALEKAKIIQRERDRTIFRLVSRIHSDYVSMLTLAGVIGGVTEWLQTPASFWFRRSVGC